jgi:hypothetical protein
MMKKTYKLAILVTSGASLLLGGCISGSLAQIFFNLGPLFL